MKAINFSNQSRRPRLITLLLFCLLSACAAKPTKPTVEIPSNTPTQDGQTAVEGEPGDETKIPTRSGPPHVALALGGAGVASFATVGMLKRFFEEGIKVDYIVTTGWPTLFALGYGFLKSVHDLEWFAMRLNERDLFKTGLFEASDPNSREKLSPLIENTFLQRDLSETSIPIFISAANTEFGDSVLYEKGDWKEPFYKTMSVPGLYRPYPKSDSHPWVQSLQGINVTQAIEKEPEILIAVEMYEDYFESLNQGGDPKDRVFRQLYLSQMKKSILSQREQASIVVNIKLNRAPNDFSARRHALMAGYKEAAKIARNLRRRSAVKETQN